MKRQNTNKSERINESVFRELSLILHDEVKDPRVSKFASVTGVEVAKDLRTARVYISVLGGDAQVEKTMKGLNNSEGFIRHELAERLNMRYTPELHFIHDDSIEYGAKMSKLIDEVIKKDEANDAAAAAVNASDDAS